MRVTFSQMLAPFPGNPLLRHAGAITPITPRGARTPLLIFLGCSLLSAQVTLTNTGDLLKVPYGCVDEELQQAGLLCTEPALLLAKLERLAEGRT